MGAPYRGSEAITAEYAPSAQPFNLENSANIKLTHGLRPFMSELKPGQTICGQATNKNPGQPAGVLKLTGA
jgi:hypothetical protein